MTMTPASTRPTDSRRSRLHAELKLLDAIDEAAPDLGEPTYATRWNYAEAAHVAALPDADRRIAALGWLADKAHGFMAVQRHLGVPAAIEKHADQWDYTIEATVKIDGVLMWLRASVPASLTCEMVEVGTEHVEAHDRPIMERRCPPSIFAGILDEVAA